MRECLIGSSIPWFRGSNRLPGSFQRQSLQELESIFLPPTSISQLLYPLGFLRLFLPSEDLSPSSYHEWLVIPRQLHPRLFPGTAVVPIWQLLWGSRRQPTRCSVSSTSSIPLSQF